MAATTKIWLNNNPPTVEDVDLNGLKNENNNLISGSGQTLDTADNEQTHKAVAHYAAGGDFYIDSGAADAYVLSTVGSQIAPPTYFTGMRIRFFPGNLNLTTSPTVNVDGLGVKNIVQSSGTPGFPSFLFLPARIFTAVYDGTDFVAVAPEYFTALSSIANTTDTEIAILSGATLTRDELNFLDQSLNPRVAFTPVLYGSSTGAGTPFTITSNCFYRQLGVLMFVQIDVAITNLNSATGNVRMTMPTEVAPSGGAGTYDQVFFVSGFTGISAGDTVFKNMAIDGITPVTFEVLQPNTTTAAVDIATTDITVSASGTFIKASFVLNKI